MSEILKALQHRCKYERDFYLSRWKCWFYTFKAIACIILRRWATTAHDDHIDVALLAGGKSFDPENGTTYWCETLTVGWGIRKGWQVWQDWDSSA